MSGFRRVPYASIAVMLWASGGLLQPASAYTERTIYSFCSADNCSDGQAPYGSLTMDSSHNIFGTTADGGDAGDGAAFELVYDSTQQNWTYSRLHSFCSRDRCADGSSPVGNLIVDTSGNLYGVTRFGGLGAGSVFKLTFKNEKWSLKTLYAFCPQLSDCPDGSHPLHGLTYRGAAAGLPYDGSSPLFGTTSEGGAQNSGVIYEVVPNRRSWKYKIIHDFCSQPDCADGAGPYDVLIASEDGKLFGTAFGGGTLNGGTIFELTSRNAKSWRMKVLYSFCALANCADGEDPNSMVLDQKGNLVGATYIRGTENDGVLFRFDLGRKNPGYSVLHDFCTSSNCADGAQPQNGPTLGVSGDIFGVTMHGGNTGCWFDDSCGIVYRYSKSTYEVIYTFCSQANCADGAFPYSELIDDGAGNLFGMAELGGAHNGGAVYELTP